MARPREFEPDAALAKVIDVFWKKGFEETSLDDIVSSTKVSRYGLYGTLGNKREMFRKALRAYADKVIGAYQGDLRKTDASLPEIGGYFENMLGFSERAIGKGCLVCNAAIEVAPGDPEIAKDVRDIFDGITTTFRKALENAKEKGQISRSIDAGACAVNLTGLIQSSALMMRVGYPVGTIRQNVEAALERLSMK